jgi:hypothetical protein
LHASLLEAMALAGKGQYAAAVDLLEANRKGLLVNRATTFLNNLAYAAAKAGQPERARQAVRELKALGGYPPPSVVLALEGRDAAVRQVREIHRRRDYVLLQARCWADYQEFRAIPEIEEIFRAAGISETR